MWSQSLLSAALLLVLPSPELASPHLYPASTFPFGSLHQPLNPVYYNGFYSPWNTFQPAVQTASAPAWQAASAPAWQAASAPARQAEFRAADKGCGDSWTAHAQAGCYKYFGGDKGKKSWEAARQHCREEGYKVGAGDADLAYFDTSQERTAGIALVLDETAWLRGKMEGDDVKSLNEETSEWTAIADLEDGDWDGGKPLADINTDRKLFIKKPLNLPNLPNLPSKLGVAKGSYEKGFLCEYKFKACEGLGDGWTLDVNEEKTNRRCLKVFTETKKNWKDAYDHCEDQGGTLAKLTPKATTELKRLATGTGTGTWVNEYSVIAQSGINLVSEDGTVTDSDGIDLDWAKGYGKDGTGTQRVFLNSKGEMANNDGRGLANFMCQKILYKEGVSVFSDDSVSATKPLVRSLL